MVAFASLHAGDCSIVYTTRFCGLVETHLTACQAKLPHVLFNEATPPPLFLRIILCPVSNRKMRSSAPLAVLHACKRMAAAPLCFPEAYRYAHA